MKTWIILIVLWLFQGISFAQDSVYVLSQDRFIQMVLAYHPLTRQSELILDRGEYGLKKARGSFDPYVFTYLDNKQFDEKEYFSILGTGAMPDPSRRLETGQWATEVLLLPISRISSSLRCTQ